MFSVRHAELVKRSRENEERQLSAVVLLGMYILSQVLIPRRRDPMLADPDRYIYEISLLFLLYSCREEEILRGIDVQGFSP